jgi:hypothetical protein
LGCAAGGGSDLAESAGGVSVVMKVDVMRWDGIRGLGGWYRVIGLDEDVRRVGVLRDNWSLKCEGKWICI